jgi:hypothetical protein
MEDKSEHNFDHVTNQSPSIPVKLISNMLLIDNEFFWLVQSIPVYIFLKTSATYAQHENLKQITFF